jgi:FKBP-type peptidyl-prolyl cis-trans isomerase FklB
MLVRLCLVGLTVLLLGSMSAALAQTSELPSPLRTPQQEAGYAIGLQIGEKLRGDGLDASVIELRALLLGVQDAMESKKPRIAATQVDQALQRVQQVAEQKLNARIQKEGKENRDLGEKFVAKYKKFAGVQTLPSGVLYRVVKEGQGPSPTANDRVKTHYTGKFVNGKVFDSSVERNEPAVFPVNRVIRGWTEALQMMKVGDKWQLVIPPEMAYGKQGTPDGTIPPESTLVFDIELLEIVK